MRNQAARWSPEVYAAVCAAARQEEALVRARAKQVVVADTAAVHVFLLRQLR